MTTPQLALLALLPLAATAQDRPAPEIEGDAWVNQFGQAPSNTSLLGRTVLIEAWATW